MLSLNFNYSLFDHRNWTLTAWSTATIPTVAQVATEGGILIKIQILMAEGIDTAAEAGMGSRAADMDSREATVRNPFLGNERGK